MLSLRFPGLEMGQGGTRVPSVLYYDEDACVRAAGAETEEEDTVIMAEEEGWTKAHR